jgi:DNA-binding PadR family transcriptional regulator
VTYGLKREVSEIRTGVRKQSRRLTLETKENVQLSEKEEKGHGEKPPKHIYLLTQKGGV